jgi:hypothetical protein
MTAINTICNDIVNNVHWATYADIVSSAAILWLVIRVFGLSPVHIMKEIVEEIGKVLQGQTSRTAIDGALTLALIAFTALIVLTTTMHELPEMVKLLRGGAEEPSQFIPLVIFMVCATIIAAILSLLITG